MVIEQLIYDLWNSYRSTRNRAGKWKGHDDLNGFRKARIRLAMRNYGGKDTIMAAIRNYHEIWLGNEYRLDYSWTMVQFFERKCKWDGIPQICAFLPDNFNRDYWLTKQEVRRRASEQRKKDALQARQIADTLKANSIKANMKSVNDYVPKRKTYQQILAECTEVKLIEEWDKNAFNRMLITKHRPDFAEKMRKKQAPAVLEG